MLQEYVIIFHSVVISREGKRVAAVFILGLILFYLSDWMWIRDLIAAFFSDRFPIQIQRQGMVLQLPSVSLVITPECTYLDWLFCAFPFMWRRTALLKNVLRLTMLTALVFLCNMIRIYLAIKWTLDGVNWFWAHDFWDYIFWYPALTLVILLWVRHRYRVMQNETQMLESQTA